MLVACSGRLRIPLIMKSYRTECLSLMYRLHLEDIVQNTFFIRNILRQPGPLYVAPEKRSNDTPSFRVIDFGRAIYFGPTTNPPLKTRETIWEEERLARKELGLDELGF